MQIPILLNQYLCLQNRAQNFKNTLKYNHFQFEFFLEILKKSCLAEENFQGILVFFLEIFTDLLPITIFWSTMVPWSETPGAIGLKNLIFQKIKL